MSIQLLPDDLSHLPSDPRDQEFLLRLLCHVAYLDERVHAREVAFIETLAEKLGRSGWEFPESEARLELHEIAQLHACWPQADGKVWLVELLRKLSAADGLVSDDENVFLSELAGILFASSDRGRSELSWSELSEDEQALLASARETAALSDTARWHRKTQKVVGAAVGVMSGGRQHVFRGVNFELSQPTGSRCAEQIALGSALVHFGDQLAYQDIRRIAVVAGENVPDPVPNPLPPCGVCCEMLRKVDQDQQQLQLYMLSQNEPERVVRIGFSDYYPPRQLS